MPHHHDRRIRRARSRPFTWPEGGGLRRHRRLVATATVGLVLFSLLYAQTEHVPPPAIHEAPSAVLIDQLDSTHPNATFVREATTLLEDAGYIVDRYAGPEVDVGLYQRLPSMGYDVILVRSHSSANLHGGGQVDVSFFTGEPYDRHHHIFDQYRGNLRAIQYAGQQFIADPTQYFSIQPRLIQNAPGDLDGAIVFVMGCQSLANDSMANAFLGRGASEYVGWDHSVTAERADSATIAWLEARFGAGVGAEEAVEAAMGVVGEDPDYESQLGMTRSSASSVETSGKTGVIP